MSQTFDRYEHANQPTNAAHVAPAKSGCGCWILGCLGIMLVMLILTIIAMGIGYYYVGKTVASYTSPTPVELPQVEHSSAELEVIQKRIESFTRQVNVGQESAEIELTADDLNAVISNNPATKGRAFLEIQDDKLKAQVSIPISGTGLADGRYLNADATLDMKMVNGQLQVILDDVTVNGQAVPKVVEQALKQTNVADALKDDKDMAQLLDRVEDFRIQDDKIILKVKPDVRVPQTETDTNQDDLDSE